MALRVAEYFSGFGFSLRLESRRWTMEFKPEISWLLYSLIRKHVIYKPMS